MRLFAEGEKEESGGSNGLGFVGVFFVGRKHLFSTNMLWIQVQFSLIYSYWGCNCKQFPTGRR